MNEVKFSEFLGEVPVDGNGNFPEKECVCGNVIKCRSLFVLDDVFEGADSLPFRNLDREDLTGIMAEHQTVEIECARHGDRWSNQSLMEEVEEQSRSGFDRDG